MALIKLIQQQPRVFKMDGQDKLRVILELPGSAERIRTAQDVLVALGAPRPG
jgi:transcription-repair coupling factor (superfamily II helicase)